MAIKAVITGDIINSREMSGKAREKLYDDLKKFLENLNKQHWLENYELFRGDSFQCTAEQSEDSLRVALMIRAYVKSYISLAQKDTHQFSRKGKKSAKGYFPGKQDIRLAVGIGAVDFIKKKSLAHSDGEAFHLSGDTLDQLKGMPYRMMLKTFDKELNESIEPGIMLLDAVIQKWTHNQAEIILFKLKDSKEDEIAAKLKISQSAVNQRTKNSQWFAIEKLIDFFSTTLKSRTHE